MATVAGRTAGKAFRMLQQRCYVGSHTFAARAAEPWRASDTEE